MRLVYSDETGSSTGTGAMLGAWASSPHIEVRYDNGSSGGAVAIDTSSLGATTFAASPSSWRDVRVNVTGAVFAHGGVSGADVWISNKGSEAAILHMVEVARW